MEIILLEQIPRLGNTGQVVKVKNGFARNFLLPQKKALRATKENKDYFESKREEIEKRNLTAKNKAEKLKQTLEGKKIVAIRQASESGRIYGSVTQRDILAELVKLISEKDITLSQIILARPIREVGVHKFSIRFHAEVEATLLLAAARTQDEAKAEFKEFENPKETKQETKSAKAAKSPELDAKESTTEAESSTEATEETPQEPPEEAKTPTEKS